MPRTTDIGRCIAALYDHRFRFRAKQALWRLGEDAIAPLARELQEPRSTPIRWVLVNLMGDIRSPAALRYLEPFSSDRELGPVVRDALRKIRTAIGEDPGAADGTDETSPADELSLREKLETALSSERCVFMAIDGGWDILMYLQGGRVQHVKVTETQSESGVPLVRVFTECGPARKGAFEWALKRNFSLEIGAFALKEERGEVGFCVTANIPREHVDAGLLGRTIRAFAEKGDYLEKKLTGKDVY